MTPIPPPRAEFPPTHWTLIAAASQPENKGALDQLYRIYWRPLCAQTRRFGVAEADVEDVAQELFVALIAGDSLARANAAHGRFRSYLLGALRNFLNHRCARLNAEKRGGGETPLPLDGVDAPAADDCAPLDVREFDADWAHALLDESVRRFSAEQNATSESRESFAVLAEFALGDAAGSPTDAAARLGLTVPAVKSRIFRLRERFHEIVREEVTRTVSAATECDEELRYLCSVLEKVNGTPSFPRA